MNNEDKKNLSGLFLVGWSAFVLTPMWLALLASTLASSNAPTYSWVLYFLYIPCVLFGLILSAGFNFFKD